MKKIKVLHLTLDSKIAGTERLLLELAEKSDRNFFDLHFCTLAPSGRLQEEIGQKGLKSYALNFKGLWNILPVYARLLRLLKKEKFDIIHTHLFLSSFLGLTAARLTGNSFCVTTRHYSDYMYRFGNFLKIKMDRLCLGLSDRVIAVSDAVAKLMKEKDRISGAKITVIHNGIDLGKIMQDQSASNRVREQFGISDSLVVGAVGSLQHRKGHSFLIEAMPLVIKQHPRAKLVIAGEGPLLENLKKQAKKIGVDRQVIFCGYCNDIYPVISAFDVFVQPSVEEGFGIAVLEALAMGKPVIASCVGGIPEIIRGNICGRLVPPADANRLAEAIIDVLNTSFDPEKLKNEGKKIIQERFNAKDMVLKYEQLYKDLTLNNKKNET